MFIKQPDPFYDELRGEFGYMFDESKCVSFGVSEGWQPLFRRLCEDLDAMMTDDQKTRFRWGQVKEKFGAMRAYAHLETDDDKAGFDLEIDSGSPAQMVSFRPVVADKKIQERIRAAEDESMHFCEVCGAPGQLRRDSYWMTLCDAHQEKRARGEKLWDD